MEPQRNIRQRSRVNFGRLLIAIIIFLLFLIMTVGIGTMIYYARIINLDTFYDGISIDGISMQGLTKEAAERILEQKNQSRLEKLNITLVYGSKSWRLDHKDLAVYLDVKEKIEQIYNEGRQGNIFQRYLTVIRFKKQGYNINTEFSYDEDTLRDNIEKIALELNEAPVDAAVIFKPDDDIKFRITPEKEGFILNVGQTIDKIIKAINEQESKSAIVLTLDKALPGIYSSEFIGKTEKIVTFGTDLSKSAAGRTLNIIKAASAFNGMIVMPGQVVSFNQTTGERTLEKGYTYAPMILNKGLVDVPGGGVSQTSTTLYNAVIRAGLEVLERTHHSFPSSYVDKGLDTTVNFPAPEIDLKFRNNKTSPIYIRTFYANKKIYFEIYGEPLPNGQKLKFYSEVYETVPELGSVIAKDFEGKYVVYEDEQHIMVQSREGYKVRVYRQTFENEKLIREELFDSQFYRPIKGLIHVGVKSRELNEKPAQSGN